MWRENTDWLSIGFLPSLPRNNPGGITNTVMFGGRGRSGGSWERAGGIHDKHTWRAVLFWWNDEKCRDWIFSFLIAVHRYNSSFLHGDLSRFVVCTTRSVAGKRHSKTECETHGVVIVASTSSSHNRIIEIEHQRLVLTVEPFSPSHLTHHIPSGPRVGKTFLHFVSHLVRRHSFLTGEIHLGRLPITPTRLEGDPWSVCLADEMGVPEFNVRVESRVR